MTERIVDHLVRTINGCQAVDEPFSHFYMENCFPRDVYEAMTRHFPDPSVYRPLPHRDAMMADGTSTRGQLRLDKAEDMALLNDEDREVWSAVVEALQSPRIKKAVFDNLRKDLASRFKLSPERVDQIDAFPKIELTRDISGYRIKVHPDTSDKLVTMQFYLPTDLSQRDFGTSLYTEDRAGLWRAMLYCLSLIHKLIPSIGFLRKISNRLFDLGVAQRSFTKVKTFDYQPNSGYGFVVSDRSWHGRELLRENGSVRNTLMYTFYLPGN
jgi:hypothetical protein